MLKSFDFEKMPIVEVVNEILVDAAKRGASDIHFDPYESIMKIRIRIDGALRNYCEIPNSIKKNLITRIKIISGMNITETRLPQDGAIKSKLKDLDLDLRVSVIPTSNGEKVVIRILDYSMSLGGLESLGFSDKNFKKVLGMISEPNGIILVTGATGTGKSTTVYSMLQRLNNVETNIITVEDPIEMNIEGVNQIQTNSEIGLDFATALRSILRQDPNVIMIGEIRDTETAKIAVRASITGHIVLSTIHTNNSLNTIERLLDMEVERYLLASALTGIISQKLARKLCPHCRVLRKTNDYEKQLFRKILKKEVNEIYTTEGCEHCGNGYSGRIAIHEVLTINQAIKDALSEGVRKEDLRKLVYTSDVTTLLQDGLEKVIQGYTTFEELLKLIELDDDDSGEAMNLKRAIMDTNISHGENLTGKKVQVVKRIISKDGQQVPAQPVEQANNATPTQPVVEQTPVAPVVNEEIQTTTVQPEANATPTQTEPVQTTPVVSETIQETPAQTVVEAPIQTEPVAPVIEEPTLAPPKVEEGIPEIN